jgi:cell division protein FtsB
MSRYNNNWGSHDQLQELRKANMALHRENDFLKSQVKELQTELKSARTLLGFSTP